MKSKLTSIVLATLATASLHATTIVVPPDEILVEKTPLIVIATVLDSASVDREGAIYTESKLAVERTLKGWSEEIIVVRELGGVVGDRMNVIFGAPEYLPGERVLAFLAPAPGSGYRTRDMVIGKFSERFAADGSRIWYRGNDERVTFLNTRLQPMSEAATQRNADGFERFIVARTNGSAAAISYETPAAAASSAGTSRHIDGDFALISEPTVYRWFTFDKGGSAIWFSASTQPGYSSGGINELKSGMAAWTGYSSAKIRYEYAGASSVAAVGLRSPNGVNEVVFNDVTNEIDGTYNARTGGVVGVGGFNRTNFGGAWVAPCAADSTHSSLTYSANNIVEANLVIQDGVTSSNGISSNVLAEIIAHEFGHTLGFGHSADGSALMYRSVTGGGPSLRSDDQLAARWLYPASTGAGTPQAPASPSALTVSIVNNTSLRLSWNDNATNETGFRVYLSGITGLFTKVADLGANATTHTVSNLQGGTRYRFYITAVNASGESAPSNTAQFTTTAPPAMSPSFVFAPANPVAGNAIQFSDQTTGGPTSWSWTFGDGTSSPVQNPVKTYLSAGSYNVTLTVANASATTSTTRTVVVASGSGGSIPLQAEFALSSNPIGAGATLSLTDQSTGSPTSWIWSFGDGTTSTLRHPTHVYNSAGTYTITLKANTATSSSTRSKSITVTAPQKFEALVPVSAQVPGLDSTYWRTELTIHNPGTSGVTAQLSFIPTGGGTTQSRNVVINPSATITYASVLRDLFGITSGSGALVIESTAASSTPSLKIASRTFTDAAIGTYGQYVPAEVGADSSVRYLPGLYANSDYRTNIGLVNRRETSASIGVTLYASDGSTLAQTTLGVGARSFQQVSLTALFPQLTGRDIKSASAHLTSSQPFHAYASVVDNRTQDPIFVRAVAAPSQFEQTIPAVARTEGAGSTYWRSDVTLHNPHGGSISVSMKLHRAGADNTNVSGRSMTIAARSTLTIPDIVSFLGNSTGSGALLLTASGAGAPVVTSRTYTSVVSGGTFGQSIDPIAAFARQSVVTGLRSDSSFRSNAGLVNSGSSAINVTVRLLSSSGAQLGTSVVPLAAKSQMQSSVAALFPGVNVGSLGSFTLRATSDSASSLFAYGSVIDNLSGDPIFIGGD